MKKISLKNVKETLSRKEMRVIAGGYGAAGCPANRCNGNGTCMFWIGSNMTSGCDCFVQNQNVGKHTC
jgi:natural product precursor